MKSLVEMKADMELLKNNMRDSGVPTTASCSLTMCRTIDDFDALNASLEKDDFRPKAVGFYEPDFNFSLDRTLEEVGG